MLPVRQGLAQSWLRHAGIAVPMVTAAWARLRSQEEDSHRLQQGLVTTKKKTGTHCAVNTERVKQANAPSAV